MLKDLNIEVKSLKDVYDDVPDIVEDGKTFKENALIKAKYVADDLHKIVLADDSGIEIDAFGKLPGKIPLIQLSIKQSLMQLKVKKEHAALYVL